MAEIVIGLGSNLDSPRDQLARALERIAAIDGLTILAHSKLYDTDPLVAPADASFVAPPQPRYLNAAIKVSWQQSPIALLDRLLEVERGMGRLRDVRWGPRVIDLDLLWSSDGSFGSDRLTLPHPELTRRAFALAPLLDVAPSLADEYMAALSASGGPPRSIGPLTV